DDFWRDLVLNPQVPSGDAALSGRSLLSPMGTTGAGRPEVYFDDAPIWLKVNVTANGLYRVSAATVSAAGVDPRTIDPATIRLFADDGPELDEATHEADQPAWGEPGGFRERAILVREGGAASGMFEEADTLLFYGLGVDNYGTTYDPAGSTDWLENEHAGTGSTRSSSEAMSRSMIPPCTTRTRGRRGSGGRSGGGNGSRTAAPATSGMCRSPTSTRPGPWP
ncbi:MAG: Uncharacterized protein FD129_1799, partial [bacterium]